MPFTAAHPAIILPLARSKRFSLTALLAGCIVPDFEFFLQMKEVENVGHHWYGILLFDLPLGLIVCYAFHHLLKQHLIPNLPATYRNRFITALHFNWNGYAISNKMNVFLSLLTGIVSHIAWDAFTHHDGFFVVLMPVLQSGIPIAGKTIPVYFLLQIVSSLAGMWLVHNSIMKMPPTENLTIQYPGKTYYWPAFVLVFTGIVMCRLLVWPQYNSFWGVVMACMGGCIYTLAAISILFKNTPLKKISTNTSQSL